MKLYKTLETELLQSDDFGENGRLKKRVIISRARDLDAALIELLLSHADLRAEFFADVSGKPMFRQAYFINYIEQKSYLSDSYTRYKNKIGLTVDDRFIKQRNEVALVWPYKDCVLEGGQTTEEQKRDEIFFNQVLARDEITQLEEPKVLTNAKRVSSAGEQPFTKFQRRADGTISDNLLVKGNNLLALHSLKKQFAGKVKLIYIDPPYNREGDSFMYNDKFSHSTWLTFMKDRLAVAKDFLTDDGVIFVHCDDNEQAYLKVLMDEVFGRDNFVQTGVVNRSSEIATANTVQKHEYFVVFAKSNLHFSVNSLEKYTHSRGTVGGLEQTMPIIEFPAGLKCYGVKDGVYKTARQVEGSSENIENLDEIVVENEQLKTNVRLRARWRSSNDMRRFFANGCNPTKAKINGVIEEIYFNSDKFNPQIKKRTFEKIPSLVLDNKRGSKDLEKLEIGFSYPKSEVFMKRIIEIVTTEGDIVLDYHIGSGTTAAVAHKMGRQYIGVEQLDYIESKTLERMKKVIDGEQGGISKAADWQGGGELVYFELKQYNEAFMERIESAEITETLVQIWEDMKANSFLDYNLDIKKQDEQIGEFMKLEIADQKQLLCEILDKNQLYVNRSSLSDADFGCSEAEKQLTQDFYQ